MTRRVAGGGESVPPPVSLTAPAKESPDDGGWSPDQIDSFSQVVLDYYRANRRSFPWRETADPWRILVSEIMLQQTQTLRVLPKYERWFELFPNMQSLADASLVDVYAAWQGLGYNNRAMRLREAARRLCTKSPGRVPDDEAALRALPGIGRYTAGAVLAFAWNQPTVILETNIRSALIFHFFPDQPRVTDSALLPLAAAALDAAIARGCPPRDWYYALMDYGVFIKKMEVNPTRRSQAYSKPTAFHGSLRQARGAVLASLRIAGATDLATLARQTDLTAPADYQRLETAVAALVAEGLLRYHGQRLTFAD